VGRTFLGTACFFPQGRFRIGSPITGGRSLDLVGQAACKVYTHAVGTVCVYVCVCIIVSQYNSYFLFFFWLYCSAMHACGETEQATVVWRVVSESQSCVL
jgi:hypothetical protein